MNPIQLTIEEKELYNSVQNINIRNSGEENRKALDDTLKLTDMLIKRKAIPENRIFDLTKKEFQFGRTKKSRKEVFEFNGTKGKAIFRHPNFIEFLHYFINGANVDNDIKDFAIASIRNSSFEDDAIRELYAFIKNNKFIPKAKNDKNEFADEIFKLSVDVGFSPVYCLQIRKNIMNH